MQTKHVQHILENMYYCSITNGYILWWIIQWPYYEEGRGAVNFLSESDQHGQRLVKLLWLVSAAPRPAVIILVLGSHFLHIGHVIASWSYSKQLRRFFSSPCVGIELQFQFCLCHKKWNAHSPSCSENLIEFATVICPWGLTVLQQRLFTLVLFLLG